MVQEPLATRWRPLVPSEPTRRLFQHCESAAFWLVHAAMAFRVGIPQAASPQAMRGFPGEIPLGVEARKNRLARVEIRQEELQSM